VVFPDFFYIGFKFAHLSTPDAGKTVTLDSFYNLVN
jgi:hypothetical protein